MRIHAGRRRDARAKLVPARRESHLLEIRQDKERECAAPRHHWVRRQPLHKLRRLHAASIPSGARDSGDAALPEAGSYALPVRPADALTLARALAALPTAVLILGKQDRTAATLVALAGLTDLLDGWLARRTGASLLGRQLDPLADKLLTDAALAALAARDRLPWPAVALLVLRDALVTALRANDGALAPSWPARLKTGALYASISLMLRGKDGTAVARAGRLGVTTAIILALLSAWRYVWRP